MLSFIWFLIIGLVAGLLARLIMPGRDAMSLLATVLLGMAGSIIGGVISWAIWGNQTTGVPTSGLLLSIIGAIVLLAVFRMVKGRSSV
ncbi:MAG: GlsB/YeaQ/YmgE family stress response membrane protein [Acidobacteria bacterium]|nr:MAG: GlsB/YeaQ/YmgE family stress response membrane protein [Acidobacteriota bacterium]